MEKLSLGVLGTSSKENEFRLPIHPLHLDRIDADLRRRIVLETGYGERFGVHDGRLAALVSGMLPAAELIDACDIVLLPKPVEDDFGRLREGQVLWGWPHCVQDAAITQTAIDRKLTLIAWEAMNLWDDEGRYSEHIFGRNNEMAGYCSVLHAMQLKGTTGAFGRRLRAAVISFGATARGAVTGLRALGIQDITILTRRSVTAVPPPLPDVAMAHYERDPEHSGRAIAFTDAGPVSLAEFISGCDVVVNCVYQDTDAPIIFITSDELSMVEAGALIIDVSCDEGMGFEWAQPTTFDDPMFTVGGGVHYYAVDHSPTYLWNSATWEISNALIPYLRIVMAGPGAWEADETIRRAIEIRDGVIHNPKILSFQGRSPAYPHPRL